MGVISTRRPDNFIPADPGWPFCVTEPPASDKAAILRDDNGATVAVANAADNGSAWPVLWMVAFYDFDDLPANSRIEWVRFRIKCAMTAGFDQRIAVQGHRWEQSGAYYRIPGWYQELQLPTSQRDGGQHEIIGMQMPIDSLFVWLHYGSPHGQDWTAEPGGEGSVDRISCGVQFKDPTNNPSGSSSLSELFLDVSYARQGAVVINTPLDDATVGPNPDVSWTATAPDQPSNPQKSFAVVLYPAATYNGNPFLSEIAYHSGIIQQGSVRSFRVTEVVDPGVYKLAVFVDQPWVGHRPVQQYWWSYAVIDVTVSAEQLPAPEVEAVSESENCRSVITIQNSFNMLTENDRGFETSLGSWVNDAAAAGIAASTLTRIAGTIQGAWRAQLATSGVPAGGAKIRARTTAVYIAQPGKTYKAAMKVGSVAGTAARTHKANIQFQDEFGAETGYFTGTGLLGDGQVTVSAQAPIGTSKAVVVWSVEGMTASAENFYMDDVYLSPGNALAGPGSDTLSSSHFEIQRSVDGGENWETFAIWNKYWYDYYELQGWDIDTNSSAGNEHASLQDQLDSYYDFSCPRGVDVIYRARYVNTDTNGDTHLSPFVSANTIRLDVDKVWITNPTNPTDRMSVKMLEHNLVRPEPQSAEDVIGSPFALVSSDGRKARRGKFNIQTETKEDYDKLDKILARCEVLFLQDQLGRDMYFRAGSIDEEFLRSTSDDSRFPVRYLLRNSFPWAEVKNPYDVVVAHEEVS